MAFLALSRVEASTRISQEHPIPQETPLRLRRALILLLLALILVEGSLALAKDVALIANKGSAVSAVTLSDLVKLCMAQTNRWPDGKAVTVIVRAPASAERKMILEKVYGMTPEALADLIATANHGRTNHPAILSV